MEFNQPPSIISPMADHHPNPNPNPSPSPNPCPSVLPHYYSLQAMRSQAGTLTVFDQRIMAGSSPNPRADPLMMGNPMNVREMLQKELEKEKIRQEIIASEVVRRRILEAEVRRELMIEREMALRLTDNEFSGENSFGLRGSRFSYVDHVDHMFYERGAPLGQQVFDAPLHRSLQLHEDTPRSSMDKDKLIVLALMEEKNSDCKSNMEREKPKPSLSGSKRKAEEPLAGDGSELSGVNCRKTPKEDWSCALCHVSATCEKGLQDHLQGKKHKAKEARLRAQRLDKNKCKKSDKPAQVCESSDTRPPNEVSLNELEVSVEKKLLVQDLNKTCALALQKDKQAKKHQPRKAHKKQKSKDPTKFKFWCEMCQIGTYSETVMENHKSGKKHRDRLKDIKLDSEAGDIKLDSEAGDAAPSTALADPVAASTGDTAEKLEEDGGVKLLNAVNENNVEDDAGDTEGSTSTWSI